MNKQNKIMMLAICVSLAVGAIMPVVAYELGQNESERMTNNVPRVIPFTGQYSKSGQTHTGQVPMSFRLYDSTTSNTALWSGSDRTVDVKDSVFSVVLGDGNDATPIGLGVFKQPALYLEIVVQGTALTPRQRLAPSPQSIYSGEAGVARKLLPVTVPNIGQISSVGLFCGHTQNTNGKIESGNLVGAQAAKSLCENLNSRCGASAHMCTVYEMGLSHQMGLIGPSTQTPDKMWVYGGSTNTQVSGANNNVSSNRDCLGYRSGAVDGPAIGADQLNGTVFIKREGGFFDNNRCDNVAAIACCDSF